MQPRAAHNSISLVSLLLLLIQLPETRITAEESEDILPDLKYLLLSPVRKVGFECWLHALDTFRDLHLSSTHCFSLTRRPDPGSPLAIQLGLTTIEDFVSDARPLWGTDQDRLDVAQYRRSGLLARAAFLGYALIHAHGRLSLAAKTLTPREFSIHHMPVQWVNKAADWARLLKLKWKESQESQVEVDYEKAEFAEDILLVSMGAYHSRIRDKSFVTVQLKTCLLPIPFEVFRITGRIASLKPSGAVMDDSGNRVAAEYSKWFVYVYLLDRFCMCRRGYQGHVCEGRRGVCI